MERFQHKTRNGSTSREKSKVYFCGRDKDFNRFFKSVSDDILRARDCAVWYSYDMVERDEEFLACLKEMQLFVIPVTAELLKEENVVMDVEFPFAMEHHIPVLPIMQEYGLQELFNKRCGSIQYLERYSADATAIRYEKKLEDYLQAVLIGDQLAAQVRAAFDAYVFLSYRKKDRKHAQELMRLIHKNEFCRDVAIWYDEFLTPGENFNCAIQEALQKSGLFVLAVTPNLVNETNYVMTTEYPMAREAGKPILPAELVPTDRRKLQESYKELPDPTDAHNEPALSAALLEAVQRMAIRENDRSPEHNFFIGLAYLSGIDVEVDYPRALELITGAAESGLEQAMQKLVDIYTNGIGVPRDCEKACLWKARINQMLWEDLQEKFREITTRKQEIEEVSPFNKKDVRRAYSVMEVYKDAVSSLRCFMTLVHSAVKNWCEKQTELSEMYRRFNNPAAAKKVLTETLRLLEEAPEYDHTNIYDYDFISEANTISVDTAVFQLYQTLISYYLDERKYSLAEQWQKKLGQWAEAVTEKYGTENPDVAQFLRELALVQAGFLYRQGEYQAAKSLLNEKIQELVVLIKKVCSADTADMSATMDNDGQMHVSGGGFGDFMSVYMRMPYIYNFFSDAFMLTGEINRKLGLVQETFDAYDEAVASNRAAQQKALLRREIHGKLRMAEYAARLKDTDRAVALLQEVEERLSYTKENSAELLAFRRDYHTAAAEVALLSGGDALVQLEKAAALAQELVQEAPHCENLAALIDLHEKMHGLCPAATHPETLSALLSSGLLSGNAPAMKELQGDTCLLLYRHTQDPALLQQARELFEALAEQYPEERGFAGKLKGIG